MKILFVCLGNICRSPAAEAVFKNMTDNQGQSVKFEVDSAGTYGGHAGSLPDSRMRDACFRRGYKSEHRSRVLTRNDFYHFDMIITMDDSNYRNVCRMSPGKEYTVKIRRFCEFCREFDIDEVPDPYYQGRSGFEYVLDILEDGCAGLLNQLRITNYELRV